MRRLAAAAAVVTGLAACGGGERAADPCAAAGFAAGSSAADGVVFAVVPRGCATPRRRACVVSDRAGVLTRAVVPAGVEQSCVAAARTAGTDCAAAARVAAPPVLAGRLQTAPRGCPGRRGGPRLEAARERTAEVAGLRVPDPQGGAPGVAGAPSWSVLAWSSRTGERCYAAGPVARGPDGPRVGSLRAGRFAPVPVHEGGTCGAPGRGPGLIVSWEQRAARRGITRGHTVVAGIAGPAVAAVEIGGVPVELDRRTRAFLRVLRGAVDPSALPVAVEAVDGARRVLRG